MLHPDEIPADATWQRGAGWALSVGVIWLLSYLRTNAGMSRQNRRRTEQVVGDAMI